MKNKLIYIFLVITIVLSVFNLTTFAAKTDSGTYGSATYVYNWDTKALTISGSGEICNSVEIGSFKANLKSLVITKIVINEGITKIADNTFEDCDDAVSVSIPSSVTYIGNKVFEDCTSLSSITVNANNKNYIATNGILFNKSKTELLRYPPAKTETSYSVPNTVNKISEYAFSDVALTQVTIPSSVKNIGQYAFYYAKKLSSISIATGITTINEGTFEYCKSLNTITIPNTVLSIGRDAFRACPSLESVALGNGVQTIGADAFYDCEALLKVTGAGNVTDIGNSAFYNCEELASIDIGDKLINIGDSSFEGCLNLTDVYLGSLLKSIGDYAFDECESLTQVNIPASVSNIGYTAFYRCTSLTNIAVNSNNSNYISLSGVLYSKDKTRLIQYPVGKAGTYTVIEGTTSIESGAFSSAANLTGVTLPDSLITIWDNAFGYCKKLSSIVIPNNVTTIGSEAFECCEALTMVTIGSKVKTIESCVFDRCISLNNIVIPPSVTSIASDAFEDANPKMTIKGKNGSYAQTFAKNNGFAFTALTTYTITYNANGGSNAPTAQPKFQGINTDLYIQEPTRANYKFLGWSTSSTSKTIAYKPGETYTANANITLYAVWEYLYPTNFTLSTLNVNLYVGDSERVLVTSYTPTNVENKSLNWTSGNPNIATVTPNDGVITAISPGTTTITAKTGDGKVSKTVSVTVLKPANNIDYSLDEEVESYSQSKIKVTIDGDKSLVKNIKWAYGSQNENYFASSGTLIDLTELSAIVNENGLYTFCLTDIDGNKTLKNIKVSKIAIGKPSFASSILQTVNSISIPIAFDKLNENIVVYMALYDNGKLVKLQKELCNPDDYIGQNTYSDTFTLAYPKSSYELKAFVWNENTMPFTDVIVLKAKETDFELVIDGNTNNNSFEFTVPENGEYTITTYTDSSGQQLDLCGYLYEGDNYITESSDIGNGNYNFSITANLTAGKTYTLIVINERETNGDYLIVVN